MSAISSLAVIDSSVSLGAGVTVGHFSIVEKDVMIGKNTRIAESVIVRHGVSIGRDVVIHPHVVINAAVVIGDCVEVFPGAYLGKEPKGAGALARIPVYEQKISIGSNASVGPNAIIYYGVEVGENTLIGDGASIRENCKIGNFSVVGRYVTLNYNVRVGNHVKIMDHTWMAGNMRVGNHVFISGGVLTSNDNVLGSPVYNEESMQGPIIEDEAAIGVGAILLPKVLIGKQAVIAAGSVVTKSVAPGSLVMGSPARLKRMNVEND